jgi:hypothetical protein
MKPLQNADIVASVDRKTWLALKPTPSNRGNRTAAFNDIVAIKSLR